MEWYSNLMSPPGDTIYKLRLTFNKIDPRNMICKLLLNSLYGKFGMSPILMDYSFSDKPDDLVDYADIQKIGNYYMLGQEITKNDLNLLKESKERREQYKLLQISTPIAIFTTA